MPDTALCFETCPELVADFAQDAGSDTRLMELQEPFDKARIALRQLAKGPRHRFHDHVVAIVEQELADGESSIGLRVFRTARTAVEGHGRHQGGAAPPSIPRARPPVHHAIRDHAEAPRDAAREAREAIDVRPFRHAIAERLDVCAPGRGDRAGRGAQDLEAKPPLGGEGGAKHRAVGSATQAFDDRSRARSPHRELAYHEAED
jgi:hypothetical protein